MTPVTDGGGEIPPWDLVYPWYAAELLGVPADRLASLLREYKVRLYFQAVSLAEAARVASLGSFRGGWRPPRADFRFRRRPAHWRNTDARFDDVAKLVEDARLD